MKTLGELKVQTADMGTGYVVTTPGVQTVHAAWEDVEKRLKVYVEKMKKDARQLG